MLNRVLHATTVKNLKNSYIRTFYSFYSSDSKTPPPEEAKQICPEARGGKICKNTDEKNLKICDEPPNIQPTSDCSKVVCEKKKKKKEPEKPVVKEITIEPLISNNFDDCKVVIVGAGIAGLAAGKYFEENNIKNYVVLEAQGRPGGRIHSEWFSDTVVELGTKCPKQSNDSNIFMQAAMADGFIKPPFSYMSVLKTCDGRSISPAISVISYDIYKRIYKESLALETNPIDYMVFRIEQEVNNFPFNVRQDVARILLGILAMQHKKEGDNLKQFVTGDNRVYYLNAPGSKLRIPLGYYGIVQPMLDRIPPEKLKLCKQVQSIRWGAVVCKDTPRALVKCGDGSVYPADYVVVTVSLGVLKERHNVLFCPALPASTVDAINSMGFYHVNNIFLQFCKPFWAWHPQTIDKKFKPEETTQFSDWLKDVRTIQQVAGSNDVLCISVVEEGAVEIERLNPCALILTLRDFFQCELGINNVPPIKCMLKSGWSNNVFFNGAYSYLPMGLADGIQSILATPLPGNNAPVTPILFFAGEATCPKLSGTVQAAKISGIREAARIKKIITSSGCVQMPEQKLVVSL